MRAELVPAISGCAIVPLGNETVRTSTGPVATNAVTGAQADAETTGDSGVPTPPIERA
jgi:hypothetical protein